MSQFQLPSPCCWAASCPTHPNPDSDWGSLGLWGSRGAAGKTGQAGRWAVPEKVTDAHVRLALELGVGLSYNCQNEQACDLQTGKVSAFWRGPKPCHLPQGREEGHQPSLGTRAQSLGYLPLTRKKKSSLNKPQKHRCEVLCPGTPSPAAWCRETALSLTFFLWPIPTSQCPVEA